MDSLLLLGLAIGLLVIVVWALSIAGRPRDDADTGLATSTEGMTICPRCGMGNLWTSRLCSACGNALKG